ncbi:MAG: hypothetical protein ACLTFC_08860, partial [Pilosibacter sp.]
LWRANIKPPLEVVVDNLALFLWIELLQYQRKLLFFTFGVSIACLLLYYKGFPTKMCEIFPLLVYCIEIFPLMLQAKKEK